LIASGQFVILMFIPISAAISQAIWQLKVAPDIQGRVFAIRSMIAFSIIPIANIAAGLLADKVFEPLMAEGSVLNETIIGATIGIGTGRGIALIFTISALFLWLSSLLAFINPRIRNLEFEIPDAIPDKPNVMQRDLSGVPIDEMVPVQGG
jgi:hypothetical protein